MSTHTEIAAALLAELKKAGPSNCGGDGTFVTVTDEVLEITAYKPGEQPVLIQYEMDATYSASQVAMQRATEFWLVIGAQGVKGKTGAQILNPLIDRIEAMFPLDSEHWNDLGGVASCRILQVRKDFGDHASGQRQHMAMIQLQVTSLAF